MKPEPGDLALTLRQPLATLCVTPGPVDASRPIKSVENRSWPPPATLPQWGRCLGCGERLNPDEWSGGDQHIVESGPRFEVVPGHAPECWGDCDRVGCPVPVQRELDPREPCGPVQPDGPFPFRMWVHAAKADTDNDRSIPRMAWDALSDAIGGDAPVRGALLGSVLVTGCHHSAECFEYIRGDVWAHDRYCSPCAEPDVYHWTLADPRPLPEPIPIRGKQRLWRIPEAVTP